MRVSPMLIAAAGLAASCGASPLQAMNAQPTALQAAMPALDPVEQIHCQSYTHAHRRGHGRSRGCGIVRRGGGGMFEPTPLQTIQSGTRPLRGETTGVSPLRRGWDSPTPSGVRPLSSERQSTSSSSSPFSLPSSGSPFGRSTPSEGIR